MDQHHCHFLWGSPLFSGLACYYTSFFSTSHSLILEFQILSFYPHSFKTIVTIITGIVLSTTLLVQSAAAIQLLTTASSIPSVENKMQEWCRDTINIY